MKKTKKENEEVNKISVDWRETSRGIAYAWLEYKKENKARTEQKYFWSNNGQNFWKIILWEMAHMIMGGVPSVIIKIER